jgi:hypothetical protein
LEGGTAARRSIQSPAEVGRICEIHLIGALENEQDDRAKVNGLFGSLNDWKG